MFTLTLVAALAPSTPPLRGLQFRAPVSIVRMGVERAPIRDFRKRQVLEVAESMRAYAEAEAEMETAVAETAEANTGRIGSYRLARRSRSAQTAQDAAAAMLVGLGGQLSVEEKDTLYLSREVSLQSTAGELANEVMAEIAGNISDVVDEAARECGAAIGELGRAAQASLASGMAPGWRAKPKAWEVAVASSRAQKAIEKLADACTHTPSHVLKHGSAASSARKRIDEAWKRDALRALIALQRAPEDLNAGMKRLRLQKLQKELRVLGLDSASAEELASLTVADLRAARTKRAKGVHPDTRALGAPILGAPVGRLFAGLLGGEAVRRASVMLSSAQFSDRPGSNAQDDDEMVELNNAFEAVRKAITAPMYF